MILKTKLFGVMYEFKSVKDVMNRASSKRSGDILAGRAARSNQERVAAKAVLSNLLMKDIFENPAVPYEDDEVTRVIIDGVNMKIYESIKNKTIGEFREWMLDTRTTPNMIRHAACGMTSEMIAAVAKLMGNMDLVYICSRLHDPKHCNTTVGGHGQLASRLQPNDTRDDLDALTAITYEGLSFGIGDAMIATNPVEDNVSHLLPMYERLADIKNRLEIPTQTCILAHITTQMKCIEAGADVDLVFQSLGGSQKTNETFGINVAMVDEAYDMMKHHASSTGPHYMYFETGEGPEDSAGGDFGTDQATMESRCYGFCKRYDPFLVDTVLGFLGPEYLYDRQQHARCALEDLFCAKMHGINIGADCCYIVSMDMDQNDEENTAMLLTMAGCEFLIGIPQGDDPMLMYQSLGFHDIAALRQSLGKEPAPEFKAWLEKWGIWEDGHLGSRAGDASIFLGK